MRKNYRRIAGMFGGLRGARILTLDSKTIEALSSVSDFLVRSPSPFSNLKYVKVPSGYDESSIFTKLKCYLLSCSPEATIITTSPEVCKKELFTDSRQINGVLWVLSYICNQECMHSLTSNKYVHRDMIY